MEAMDPALLVRFTDSFSMLHWLDRVEIEGYLQAGTTRRGPGVVRCTFTMQTFIGNSQQQTAAVELNHAERDLALGRDVRHAVQPHSVPQARGSLPPWRARAWHC